tara:strand:- start:478 stop:1878 length:1401 start_codon:yes stop_codon:yes gene_type:complete
MSTSKVRKELSDKLLQVFLKEETDATRTELQNSRPQVVFIQDLEWLDMTILKMMENSKHLPKKRFRRYNTPANLKKARALGAEKQKNWLSGHNKDITQTKVMRHFSISYKRGYDAVLAGEAFIVGSFSTARELKKEIVTKLVTRKSHKPFKDDISQRVDVGHGEAGKAVAVVQAAKGIKEVYDVLDEKARKEFDTALESHAENLFKTEAITGAEKSLILELIVDYKCIIDKNGKVNAEYVPALSYQDKYTNQGIDGPREKKLKQIMADFFKDIGIQALANMEGSDSLNTQISKQSVKALVALGTKIKRSKLVLDPKLKGAIKSGKGKAKSKQSSKSKVTSTKNKRAVGRPVGFKKASKASKSAHTMTRLLPMINAKLSDTVAKNMGPPALENRTGRFAGSVRATDVSRTPKGFASVGYTYQKFPYQTFEMGYAQGDPKRDPRTLIDRSIREIAAELAIGRLYTRRT